MWTEKFQFVFLVFGFQFFNLKYLIFLLLYFEKKKRNEKEGIWYFQFDKFSNRTEVKIEKT
jgi:hypothetical protein